MTFLTVIMKTLIKLQKKSDTSRETFDCEIQYAYNELSSYLQSSNKNTSNINLSNTKLTTDINNYNICKHNYNSDTAKIELSIYNILIHTIYKLTNLFII